MVRCVRKLIWDNQTTNQFIRSFQLPELLTICEGEECARVNGPPTPPPLLFPLLSRSFPLEKNELMLLWLLVLLRVIALLLLLDCDCSRTVDNAWGVTTETPLIFVTIS